MSVGSVFVRWGWGGRDPRVDGFVRWSAQAGVESFKVRIIVRPTELFAALDLHPLQPPTGSWVVTIVRTASGSALSVSGEATTHRRSMSLVRGVFRGFTIEHHGDGSIRVSDLALAEEGPGGNSLPPSNQCSMFAARCTQATVEQARDALRSLLLEQTQAHPFMTTRPVRMTTTAARVPGVVEGVDAIVAPYAWLLDRIRAPRRTWKIASNQGDPRRVCRPDEADCQDPLVVEFTTDRPVYESQLQIPARTPLRLRARGADLAQFILETRDGQPHMPVKGTHMVMSSAERQQSRGGDPRFFGHGRSRGSVAAGAMIGATAGVLGSNGDSQSLSAGIVYGTAIGAVFGAFSEVRQAHEAACTVLPALRQLALAGGPLAWLEPSGWADPGALTKPKQCYFGDSNSLRETG